MGFSKSCEGTVAILPRQVEEPSSDNKSCAVSGTGAMSLSVRKKPAPNIATANVLDTAVVSTTPNINSGGLYGLVKEHVQVMRNSSSSLDGPRRSGKSPSSVAGSTNYVERTPTVYFCESKNIVVTASSAEESFCRYKQSLFILRIYIQSYMELNVKYYSHF